MSDHGSHDPHAVGDHVDRLYRAAWCMCGSSTDAASLVEETYELVLRRKRVIDPDDLGHLLTAMRHAYIGSVRTGERRPVSAPPLETAPRVGSSPPDIGDPSRAPDGPDGPDEPAGDDHSAAAEALYAEVARLPDKIRDAVITVDVVCLSPREAARALKVREATLTARVERGRLLLTTRPQHQ